MKVRKIGLISTILISSSFLTTQTQAAGGLLGGSGGGDQCMVEAAKVYLDCANKGTAGAVKAVDIIGAWVAGGTPEKEPFEYRGIDGEGYNGTFSVDILPLFTARDIWFEGARSCASCHFDNSENSYHEMDLTS